MAMRAGQLPSGMFRINVNTSNVDPGRIALPGETLHQLMRRLGDEAVEGAVNYLRSGGHVDSGALAGSITVQKIYTRGRVVGVTVGSDVPYARYVHEGTTGPIEPTNATFMKFIPKGGGLTFAREVAGQSAKPFLTEGGLNAIRSNLI